MVETSKRIGEAASALTSEIVAAIERRKTGTNELEVDLERAIKRLALAILEEVRTGEGPRQG
jgi:hypothetical protein